MSEMRPPAARRSSCLWIVIPVGCLSLLLLGCGGAIVSLVFGVTTFIKTSEPFEHALAEVRADPQTVQVLGQPIEAGWWVTGSLRLNNDDGQADFHFPVSGPNGSASVHVRATKNAGSWSYESILVTFDDGAAASVELAEPVAEIASPDIEVE